MVKNDQIFEFTLEPQSIHEIERFTDLICDQLYINETYYGNILMSLTNLFELCRLYNSEKQISISYNTDYQTVRLAIQPVDSQIIEGLGKDFNIEKDYENEAALKLFLLRSLTDNVDVREDNIIELVFDISAMHNTVYDHRRKQLDAYFKKQESSVFKKENDKLL